MATTSRTLLERARDSGDHEAWERFYGLYAPLLERYARALGLSAWDAEEVRDQCLLIVAARLPGFEYDPARGGFKAWLHRVVRAKVVDLVRRASVRSAVEADLTALVDPSPSPEAVWDAEWRAEHLRYALQEARRRVGDEVYEAFRRSTLEERPALEVAGELGLTLQQVYKARPKVLARVREALERLGLGEDADLGL